MERKAVQAYLGLLTEEKRERLQDVLVRDAYLNLDISKIGELAPSIESLVRTPAPRNLPEEFKPPLCDRCHNLVHHNLGDPIHHPTIESLRDTIDESPYKYNHIYHILDAADFPMSLLPRINQLLDAIPLRSQNRRSRSSKFHQGRKTEMSFIITRSDLLAPTKEQVDRLMPFLISTLREVLGRVGRRTRLGNVRCVSAKRGWWTKELKEDIWERGGAGWMVGKVNVGKSRLFEAVFPKGRMGSNPPGHRVSVPIFPMTRTEPPDEPSTRVDKANDLGVTDPPGLAEPAALNELSLLPPPRPETDYPQMPIASDLPGTTASPIRVPFGNGRGELIDLPGFARSELGTYVKEEHQHELMMKSRVVPEQQVMKPGRSLLLGGLIRITPQTPDLTFLAYAFTPLEPHLTSTEKAIAVQEQLEGAPNVPNISRPGTQDTIQKAGSFQLRYDVTRARAGPITRRDAAGIKVEKLPYRVVGIDLLIEGCGWVEIVAQVRTRHLFDQKREGLDEEGGGTDEGKVVANPQRLENLDLAGLDPNLEAESERKELDSLSTDPNWPVVDVYSPEGRFIGSRGPMNGWLLNRPLRKATKSRPRRSMKNAKKSEKAVRRQAVSHHTI